MIISLSAKISVSCFLYSYLAYSIASTYSYFLFSYNTLIYSLLSPFLSYKFLNSSFAIFNDSSIDYIFSIDLISTSPPCSGSSIINLSYSICSRNSFISFILCELLRGSSLSLISIEESSCYPFFAPSPFIAGLAAGALPATGFPLPPANFYSSSLYFLVSLGSLRISISYAVNSSPLSFLSYKKYFLLAFLAFSALPGSLSSHDFFNSFSASSFDVSRIIIIVSDEKLLSTQIRSLVSSFNVLHSGQSLRSNDAYK